MATDADHDEGDGLNPVWLANNYLRRRKYDECIAICTGLLEKNPYDQVRRSDETRGTVGRRPGCDPTPTPATALRGTDPTLPSSTSPLHSQAVWYLKCRALTLKNWIDDMEIEEEVRPPRLFFQTGKSASTLTPPPRFSPFPAIPGRRRGSVGRERHRADAPPGNLPHASQHLHSRGPTKRWRASRHSWRATRHRLCPAGDGNPARHRQVRGGRVQGRETRNDASSHLHRKVRSARHGVYDGGTRRGVHQRR